MRKYIKGKKIKIKEIEEKDYEKKYIKEQKIKNKEFEGKRENKYKWKIKK